MNARRKGKVGEREFAALLRDHGFDARRGVQFAGGAESPDVICPALPWLHIEIKRVQALNLADACAQAEGDCGRGAPAGQKKPWVVAHRRNHAPWLITMTAEVFFQLLRGDLPPAKKTSAAELDSLAPARSAPKGLSPAANSLSRFPSGPNLRGELPPGSINQTSMNEPTNQNV